MQNVDSITYLKFEEIEHHGNIKNKYSIIFRLIITQFPFVRLSQHGLNTSRCEFPTSDEIKRAANMTTMF